jgi:indolepyruvate ferredoxin oxidoreductase
MERRLIREYEAVVEEILQRLSPDNHALCVELARIPERIRGYGHVKDANLETAKREEAQLLATLREAPLAIQAAE